MKEYTTQQKIYIYGAMALKAIAPLVIYAVVPSIVLGLGYVLGGHQNMTLEEFVSYGANFYSAVGIFLVLWIFHRKSKKHGSTLREDATLFFNEMKPLKAIGFFAFGFASATAVSALLTLLPDFFLTRSYTASSQRMYMGRDIIFTALTLLFTAPMCEEIIFRGYMLNTLLEKLPENAAIWISSAVFALMHGNILWIAYALLLGWILAKTSMKEDNIAYGVLLHVGFNLTSMVNMFILESEKATAVMYGSNIQIALYGLLGLAVSLALAGLYTGRIVFPGGEAFNNFKENM